MATTTSKLSKRQAGASARLRTYNRLRRVEARMDDVFSTARQFMRPHESILAELTRQVYDTPDFKKLRGIDQSYLSGKSKALMDAFYRYELEWRVSLEGRLMPGSEVPTGRWSEVEAEAGRHVYKRDPARHFAGKGRSARAIDFRVGDHVVVMGGPGRGLHGVVTYVGSGPRGDMVSVDLDHPVHRMTGPAILHPRDLRRTP